MSGHDEMDEIRSRQWLMIGFARHFVNVLPYALVTLFGGTLLAIGNDALNGTHTVPQEVANAAVPTLLAMVGFYVAYLIFYRAQSRREDIDLANHHADEADRPVPPPY